MITTSVAKEAAETTRRSDQRHRPMGETARRANREWYPGLCSTCINDSACTFPRSADRPVLTCDEFQGVQPPPRPAPESPLISDRFAVANREWLPGLCKTCAKQNSCTFPKPEGGVFNCEEFE